MKYGIDRNSPDEIRRQQSEKAYKELYARFETMVGLKSPKKKTTTLSARNAGSQPVKKGCPKSPHPGQSEAKETQDGTLRDSVKQEQHH